MSYPLPFSPWTLLYIGLLRQTVMVDGDSLPDIESPLYGMDTIGGVDDLFPGKIKAGGRRQ